MIIDTCPGTQSSPAQQLRLDGMIDSGRMLVEVVYVYLFPVDLTVLGIVGLLVLMGIRVPEF